MIGTLFEGETILVLGGFAAHRGYLSLWGVVAAAFLGSLAGDQLYFHLGRWKGPAWLERRPHWKRGAARAQALIERHHELVILGFRFLYGVRTLTPFVLGMSGVSPRRFAVLNVVAAGIWAVVVGLAGYALGNLVQALLGEVQRVERVVFLGILGVGALFWGVHFARRLGAGSPPG